jgi:hypothetical protein
MKAARDIIRYYGREGSDDCGRSLAEVQAWPDDLLESVHDFIQWMFPLREHSLFNPDAPVLDDNAIGQFRSSPELKANLHLSFTRMLKFYGLEIRSGPDARVVRGPDFQERAAEWLLPGDHNHLRITRILKSLSLLGLEQDARSFFELLSEIYGYQDDRRPLISPETFRYWKAAIS